MVYNQINKKGQFYLIAAIFIILILFGVSSVATYAVVKPEPRTIRDLSQELNRETYNIVEHGVFKKSDLNMLLEKFSGRDMAEYVLKNSEDASIVFVYGNKQGYNAIAIANQGIGKIRIGNSDFNSNGNDRYRKKEPNKVEDYLELKVSDVKYKFELKDNEMFYFLIVKERDDEIFVERDKEDKSNKEFRPGGARRKRR